MSDHEKLIHPSAPGFAERVTPKQLPETVFLYRCTCGKAHFRHAGYLSSVVPFMRVGGEKKIAVDDVRVLVCVSCKRAYAWIDEQAYDITEHIDLEAWERTEKEAHKATGPGGQC